MTTKTIFAKAVVGGTAMAVALLAVTPVFAQYGGQSQPPAQYPSSQYPNQQSQPGPYTPPNDGYDRAPPRYDNSQPPPPPPGYQPGPNDQRLAEQDRYYADQAQRWAAENCVKSRGDAGGGALLGGLLGAIIGHSVGSRGDRGTSTVAGAVIGGVGGAAIGSSSGEQTSPGCPPGYVVRRGVQPYYFGPEYIYAAPAWYHPWFYYGGRWVYRPYPYHEYYARRYYGYGHPEWHKHEWHGRDGGDHRRP